MLVFFIAQHLMFDLQSALEIPKKLDVLEADLRPREAIATLRAAIVGQT
jgi:hypothetical protein